MISWMVRNFISTEENVVLKIYKTLIRLHIEYYTGWNDKMVVLKKTTLQLYFKTFFEKINSGNLIM